MKLQPLNDMEESSKREPVPIRVTETGTVDRQGRRWTPGEVLHVHPGDARRLIEAGSAEAVS